ncbi:MAG: putative oxidoreductase [Gemmatimonadales bacterium]|jgi:3-oxosteroid 1-dehydrogenase|nr:putative oxidoreductase [Gemmatimonadales bacterium]
MAELSSTRTVPETADVVVIGSGAAGLSAALSARVHGAGVVLLEKAPTVGGTAALSAGAVWIPVNHLAAAAGIEDSREDAIRYIASLSNDRQDPETVAAFVDAAPEVLRWIEENTRLRFVMLTYPDYHSENPGALPKGGRSVAEKMFPFAELGPWAAKVTLSPGQIGRMRLGPTENMYGGGAAGPSDEVLADREARDLRGWGQALVGGLLAGLLERGVEPVTSAHTTELVLEGDRVIGVRGTRGGEPFEIRANGGVVIATGGFDWAPDLVRAYLRGPLQNSVAVRENVGDGLRMAQQVGAELGTMQEAFWTPLIRRPGDVRHGDGVFPRSATVVAERARPGSIIVNRAGKRFCDEATNYNSIAGAFHAIDTATLAFSNLPAYLIFDEGFRSRGPVADNAPGDEVPDWMVTAPTLAELAAVLDVDAEGLAATVARFNENAEAGHDPDFHRGESAFERANGDLTRKGPAANLAPLVEPPFYAVEIEIGAFGTRGGPLTDGVGRVQRAGQPVPGLYAAGNAAASVMGMAYPGGGSTLGPALTFGHLAGRHAATGK